MSNILEHRTEIPVRQPTHKEAVDIVCRCLTQECRHSCIAHWRRLYGDEFANKVEDDARKRHESKK